MTTLDDTIEKLTKEKQRTNRLAQQGASTHERQRKEAMKLKIKLGTLVVNAGLGEESITVLRGLLQEAAQTLAADNNQKIRERWQSLGAENANGKT